MIKLRWLEIRKFRNVQPTRLTFNDGFNVLLGKNATGKTSLLKLIEILLRDEKDGFPQEIFDISYEIGDDETTILIHCASREIEREGRHNGKKRYDLSWDGRLLSGEESFDFSSSTDSASTFHIDSASEETIVESSIHCIDRNIEKIFSDETFEFNLRFYGISYHISRMDEGVELFEKIKKAVPVYTFQEVQRVDFLLNSSLFPEEIWGHHDRDWFHGAHVGQPLVSGWNHGKFAQISRYLGLDASRLLAVVKKKDIDKEGVDLKLGDIQFVFRRKDGSEFSDEYLSFGQKRFLTFLYLLWSNEDVCIADELVNGLHHAWIRQAIEEIGQRQAFLTSQNPILFDYIPLATQQDAQRSFLLCSNEVDSQGVEWLVWKNVDEGDARRIFEAYDSGLETLGQILETRGLW